MGESKIIRRAGGVNVKDANANANDVLQNKTFYSGTKDIKTGTIPSKSAQTFTPGTSNQVITAGQYLSGNQTILGSPNLIPDNIRNGVTIFGVTGNIVVFSPIQATGGSISDVNISGVDYRVHSFTSTGTSTFSVQNIGTNGQVEVLIVAGGGSGSGSTSGGGGAGGLLQQTVSIAPQNYSVVVGAGGAAPATQVFGNNGQNSSAFNLTAVGGGRGGGTSGSSQANPNSGGSGGGGGRYDNRGSCAGASGTSGQGNSGGSCFNDTNPGGGGGGAGGAGGNATSSQSGNGGPGLSINFDGTTKFYAAGGGGGSSGTRGTGGSGIGGNGASNGDQGTTSGAVNTGSGGGGG